MEKFSIEQSRQGDESNPESHRKSRTGKLVRVIGLLVAAAGGGVATETAHQALTTFSEKNSEMSQASQDTDEIGKIILEDGKITIGEVEALRSIWEETKREPITFENSIGQIVELTSVQENIDAKMNIAFDLLTDIAEMENALEGAKEKLSGVYVELQLEQNKIEAQSIDAQQNTPVVTPGVLINEQAGVVLGEEQKP